MEGRRKVSQKVEQKCLCPKILLVGNDPFNLKAIALMLKISGFHHGTAKDGAEAIKKTLERYKNNTCKHCDGYCLIIMNLDIPRKNGYETSYEILQMSRAGKLPKINIVVLMKNFKAEIKKKCLNIGVKEVICKPVTTLEAVQRLLRKWCKYYK